MAAGFSEIRETVTNEKERGTSTNANQPAKDDFQESFEKKDFVGNAKKL